MGADDAHRIKSLTAAVSQIDAMIGEDLLLLGRREREAISEYAELEQQSQSTKRPGG